MTTLRLDTCEGAIPLDEEWEDDSGTIPIDIPPDVTPETLRLLADAVAATTERIAADLERHGNGFSVLMGSHAAAARVRSLQWARPRRAA